MQDYKWLSHSQYSSFLYKPHIICGQSQAAGMGNHCTQYFFNRSAASLESRASPEKADEHSVGGVEGGGGGWLPTLFFPFYWKQIGGQFSRHGVGVSSYITNIYNKQAKNNKKFFTSKRGVQSHPSHPLPPFGRAWATGQMIVFTHWLNCVHFIHCTCTCIQYIVILKHDYERMSTDFAAKPHPTKLFTIQLSTV